MKISVKVESPVYKTYRAERVRSLFNVSSDQGSQHSVEVDLPIDEWDDWKIGAIIGPSGSGKTTLGKHLFKGAFHEGFFWDDSKPIIDEIGGDKDFNDVTSALSGVGLGSVPSWLRPFNVLSMGEKFRAEMARIIIEKPEKIVIDEFTSVIDRQIAKVGSFAFAKAWRRTGGKVIILSCHYDIIDWLTPDWILDTKYWEFSRGHLRQRPEIKVDIYSTGSSRSWAFFEPHHYLKVPMPVAPTYYIGEIEGSPVAHLCVSTTAGLKSARLTRLVVMPEWQGCGVGMKFLEFVARLWLRGENRYNKKMTGIIHTSHPGLITALSKSSRWVTVSQQIGGSNREKSRASISKAKGHNASSGYGGHLRAVAGFRFVGERSKEGGL